MRPSKNVCVNWACHKGQGWHFGRPTASIAATRTLLAERNLLPQARADVQASRCQKIRILRRSSELRRSRAGTQRLRLICCDMIAASAKGRAMRMRFHKMHGLGNDFVVSMRAISLLKCHASRASAIADRRAGIGCDQLILLEPSATLMPDADLQCRWWRS